MRRRHYRGLLAVAVLIWFGAFEVRSASYFVDSVAGDDSLSGLSPEQPWQTLNRVNRETFRAGDEIFFKAGTRYSGQLVPQGSGAVVDGQPRPIRIGRYGEGDRPRIDGQGGVLDTLLLRNVEFWEVSDLEITNEGSRREAWRTGVRVVVDDFGSMRHIRLKGLLVHDVNGDLRKSREGCGIFFESRGGKQSRFEGLWIENCHVVRTDRNGICQRTVGRARSVGVVVRGNLLEDIGGDGIKIWGSNGALVERNTLRGGRTRCDDYAAGIWPFDSDDTLIQFNEVSGMKGIKDGQGFDSDYRCRRSVFQYNYSHDNEGGFFLVCSPGNSFNEGTIIRHNISQNDGINSARIIHFGGGATRTRVHNNTIYVGSDQNLPLLLFTDWDGGNASETRFEDNILFVDGRVTYDLGNSRNTVFEGNMFFGNHVNPPLDRLGTTNRPPLVAPGSGKNGLDSLHGYRFQEGARDNQRPGALFPDWPM